MIKAIETKYKGYRFRSRLEARWAVFFDSLGTEWEYEPEGFDLGNGVYYLPDFFIKGNGHRGPFIEIKPTEPTEIEINKLVALCEGRCAYGLLISGAPGDESVIEIHKEGFVQDVGLSMVDIGLPSGLQASTGQEYLIATSAARAARFGKGGRG